MLKTEMNHSMTSTRTAPNLCHFSGQWKQESVVGLNGKKSLQDNLQRQSFNHFVHCSQAMRDTCSRPGFESI